MRDNDIVKSADAEFLDQSWDKMRLLLDEHMPHAMPPKPSRPKYELLLLLGLFAWTVYLYWPVSDQPMTPDYEASPAEAIAASAVSEANETKVATIADQAITTQTASAASEAIVLSNDSKSALNNKLTFVTQGVEETMARQATKQAQLATRPITQPLAAVQPATSFARVETTTKHSAIDLLASKSPNSLSELRNHSKPFLKPMQAARKINMGLHFGGIIDRSKYSGFTFGVFAEIGLNKRFSLFSALELSSIKKVNPVENSFNAAEDFFAMHPSSSMDKDALEAGMSILYGTDAASEDFKVLGIDEMNYVNVPVELVFKVNPTMRVNAGLSFYYLLNAKMQNADRQGGWQSNELVEDNPLEGKYGQELLGVAINRFDIAPSIGFSFKPMQKLTLDLKFRNGIADISKDKFFGARETHTNRYLHLGVGWDLYSTSAYKKSF